MLDRFKCVCCMLFTTPPSECMLCVSSTRTKTGSVLCETGCCLERCGKGNFFCDRFFYIFVLFLFCFCTRFCPTGFCRLFYTKYLTFVCRNLIVFINSLVILKLMAVFLSAVIEISPCALVQWQMFALSNCCQRIFYQCK